MTTTFILYLVGAFAGGAVVSWIACTAVSMKWKKLANSTEGFLVSERLKKETLRNESEVAHQQKQILEIELTRKLNDAKALLKQMDTDILLLQKSNEETEQQLADTHPELHSLKVKLIEANNTIARYKSQLGLK